jgi:hypothetical protein
MIEQFSTILLDMNDTFMFGADRFGATEDYSMIYHQLVGTTKRSRVNQLIRSAYRYLGGAIAAGISCILAGGASHPSALGSAVSLLDVVESIGTAS